MLMNNYRKVSVIRRIPFEACVKHRLGGNITEKAFRWKFTSFEQDHNRFIYYIELEQNTPKQNLIVIALRVLVEYHIFDVISDHLAAAHQSAYPLQNVLLNASSAVL